MKTSYRCEYILEGIGRPLERKYVRGQSLGDFKDGFWITDNFKLTRGSNCKYWVPPTQILLVCKDRISED